MALTLLVTEETSVVKVVLMAATVAEMAGVGMATVDLVVMEAILEVVGSYYALESCNNQT